MDPQLPRVRAARPCPTTPSDAAFHLEPKAARSVRACRGPAGRRSGTGRRANPRTMRCRPKRRTAPVPGTRRLDAAAPRHLRAGPVVLEVHVGPVVAHREPAHRDVAQVMRRFPDHDLLLAPPGAERRSAAGHRRRRVRGRPRAAGRCAVIHDHSFQRAASPIKRPDRLGRSGRTGPKPRIRSAGAPQPVRWSFSACRLCWYIWCIMSVISSSTSTSHVTWELDPSGTTVMVALWLTTGTPPTMP